MITSSILDSSVAASSDSRGDRPYAETLDRFAGTGVMLCYNHTVCVDGGLMKTPKHSLRKIVNFLNNPDEDGGFWLPNIQRPFVWSEDQTCRLFDSILRQYPISTLLVWKTNSPI